MKILKKILPLASIASVAAVAAPLATSCSTGTVASGSYTFSWDAEDTSGLTKYEPKFTPAPQQSENVDITTANSIYFSKLDADKSLLFDDMATGLFATLYSRLNNMNKGMDIKKIDGSFNLNVNSIKPYEYEEQSTKKMAREISFSAEFKVNVVREMVGGDETIEQTGSITQKITCSNVLLIVQSREFFNLGFLPKPKKGSKFGDWTQDKTWEVKVESKSIIDGATETGGFKWNYENVDEKTPYRSPFTSPLLPSWDYSYISAQTLIGSNYGVMDNYDNFCRLASTMLDDEDNLVLKNHFLSKNKYK